MTRLISTCAAARLGAVVAAVTVLSLPVGVAAADDASMSSDVATPVTRSEADTAVGVLAALGAVGVGGGLVVVARRKRS